MRKETLKKAMYVLETGAKLVSVGLIGSGIYGIAKQRGLGKLNDKELITNASLSLAGCNKPEGELIRTINVNGEDYDVIFNPYILIFGGIQCCGILNSSYGKFIVCDKVFAKLDSITQQVLVAHELGHAQLGHRPDRTDALKRIMEVMKGNVSEMELEADAYAADILGNRITIMALKDLKKHVGGYMSKREIDFRIKVLEASEE